MKAIVALFAVIAVALAVDEVQTRFLFEEFRAQHNKAYANAYEALMRYDIFSANVQKMIEFNKHHSYKVGINQFADMTTSEYLSFVGLGKYKPAGDKKVGTLPKVNAPDSIDWTQKGALPAVKNQAQCGSCWAFSATAAVEALNQIKTGKLIALSEQQLVDCVTECSGCNGGRMDTAFEYLEGAEGQCAEEEYPYKAVDGDCKKCTAKVQITGHTNLPTEDCPALLNAAAQQVVSIAVGASDFGFQFYDSGIITEDCDESLNHGISLVGYGTESGTKYWKARNSWGATWGEKGYVRILRADTVGEETMWGIAKDTVVPQM